MPIGFSVSLASPVPITFTLRMGYRAGRDMDLFPSITSKTTPSRADAPLRLAKVVLERGIDHPDGLTYSIPASIPDLTVGDRVAAPLGRGNAPSHGYVVEVGAAADLDPGRIKPILRREGVSFPQPLVKLAQWMSLYYCCPIGMVLATMMPAAVKKQTGQVTRVLLEKTGVEPTDRLPPTVQAAWDALRGAPANLFPIAAKDLARKLLLPTVGPINRLVRLGVLRPIEVKGVRVVGEWDSEAVHESSTSPRLTAMQQSAVDRISGTLGTFAAHVLLGVTGSGKTEVYLNVLSQVLERGQSAIVLVPEISLTPQTAGRFVGRFGTGLVAVLHSGLTASQRHREWARVASGEARVVVGARSAVFAPFGPSAPLGLIVVDEEHDNSYKQDQLPRYHARDVALKRAQIESCPVVLGSATPSLESWHNAQRGKFSLIELPERVAGGTLPKVEIVDIIEERRQRTGDRKHPHALGPRLERAVGAALDQGGQVILLLNRRGFASYIACPDQACGWVLTCDHCDVTMVHHRTGSTGGLVRCHHCLAERTMPAQCPTCAKRVSVFGIGTQRLEEELERKFSMLRTGQTMLRLDSDTMHRAIDYHRALSRFGSGEIRLLLGTQMIAKGLDFPGVTLIGVVNADTGLDLPDFRASERTFQLVSQVAGRAGRSAASAARSRVIVQTVNPHEPAIVHAAAHDYKGFAAREIEYRSMAGLPPVGRMARLVFRDEDAMKAETNAWEVAQAIQATPESKRMTVRGPMPCPISRVAGQYRFAIEMLAPDAMIIQRVLTQLRNAGLVKSDANIAVDVDPLALL